MVIQRRFEVNILYPAGEQVSEFNSELYTYTDLPSSYCRWTGPYVSQGIVVKTTSHPLFLATTRSFMESFQLA